MLTFAKFYFFNSFIYLFHRPERLDSSDVCEKPYKTRTNKRKKSKTYLKLCSKDIARFEGTSRKGAVIGIARRKSTGNL